MPHDREPAGAFGVDIDERRLGTAQGLGDVAGAGRLVDIENAALGEDAQSSIVIGSVHIDGHD